MNKEKSIKLQGLLKQYKELQEESNVTVIEFHTSDGKKHGIGNPEAIKLLLSVAVIELERQLWAADFGDIPQDLKESREYKAAKEMERALNCLSFTPERFAESVRFMHPTLQQTFFKVVRACIVFMADGKNLHIDGRNCASHEMCKKLADAAKNSPLPFI